MVEYELYHHGIKGMRWGVRRYQNKNGTLTAAGKKRYSDDPELARQKNDFKAAKSRYEESTKALNKASDRYSYLPTSNNRKELEKARDNFANDKNSYARAKLTYKTNKEVARLKDKGVTFENKSKHRLKLEDQYKKMGMADEQAQAAANNRIRTEKILAASAAITVTACAAYIANKQIRNRIDQVIKAGERLQRVEMQDTGGKLHDMFYVAKGEHDMKRYENLLGMARQQSAGKAYLMKMEAASDVKIASKYNAAKVFGDLYRNDADFRESVADHVKSHFAGHNVVKNVNNLSSRNINKMYENFNVNLMWVRDSRSGADKKFYDKLKSAGYGAIQDINDMKYSGYNARNPLIVFDNSKKSILVKSVNEMTENLNNKGTIELLKATGESLSKDFLEKAGPLSAAALTTAAVSTYRSSPDNPYEQKKRKK